MDVTRATNPSGSGRTAIPRHGDCASTWPATGRASLIFRELRTHDCYVLVWPFFDRYASRRAPPMERYSVPMPVRSRRLTRVSARCLIEGGTARPCVGRKGKPMNGILKDASDRRSEAHRRAVAHEVSANAHRRQGVRLGVASTTLSAIVGSAIFITAMSQLHLL